jgi:sugar diacid utilization regulator
MPTESDVALDQLGDTARAVFETSEKLGEQLCRRHGPPAKSFGKPDDPRRRLLDALLDGAQCDEPALVKVAVRAGQRLGHLNAVAVLDIRSLGAQPNGSWQRIVNAAAQVLSAMRFGQFDAMVAQRDAELVAIYPVRPSAVAQRIVERLRSALREASFPTTTEIVLALGNVEEGLDGIARSYNQARQALSVSMRCPTRSEAVLYSDMLPAMLLLRDEELAADVHRVALGAILKQGDRDARNLIATLRALVVERGNASAAAKRLGIHRHTLSARQQRIERLTGLRLRSARDLLLIELGLEAHDMLMHPRIDEASASVMRSSRQSIRSKANGGRTPRSGVS